MPVGEGVNPDVDVLALEQSDTALVIRAGLVEIAVLDRDERAVIDGEVDVDRDQTGEQLVWWQ